MKYGPVGKHDVEDVRAWFAYPEQPHVATLQPSGWLTWRRPGTSVYAVNYLCYGRNLIVVGDIGDAVFAWSERVTWDFLVGCHLDYLLGKCQASETGRMFYHWDPELLLQRLRERFTLEEGETIKPELAEARDEALIHVERWVTNEYEWYAWASENTEVLGDDYSEFFGCAHRPHMRAIGMLEGLKLAVAQLKAAGTLPLSGDKTV